MQIDYPRLLPWAPPHVPQGGTLEAQIVHLRDLAHALVQDGVDNPAIPAGYTYFGQFVDHDVTYAFRDRDPARAPAGATNLRSPALDLDSVYGHGPLASPHLYVRGKDGAARFAVGSAFYDREAKNREEPDLPRAGGLFAKVARDAVSRRYVASVVEDGKTVPRQVPEHDLIALDGTHYVPVRDVDLVRTGDGWRRAAPLSVCRLGFQALIADPRNDANVIVAQLHRAFLELHDRVIEDLGGRLLPEERFETARRLVRWHYQWVVLHDFLPRLLGREACERHRHALLELAGEPLYDGRARRFVPLEFALAAYRAGHAMVRPTYALSDLSPRPVDLFQVGARGAKAHLGGERCLPDRWTLQWDRFLEIGGSDPQKSRRIAPRLSKPLAEHRVPGVRAVAPGTEREPYVPGTRRVPFGTEGSEPLAFATLLRGFQHGLPAGQDVARRLGLEPLDGGSDPLWIYVLREAEELAEGRHLGPVGGRLVAETFFGLLRDDPSSFWNAKGGWRPIWARAGGEFGLADLLRHAGAPLTAADVELRVFGPEGPPPRQDRPLQPAPRRTADREPAAMSSA